jgi:glyoxylase-like metal-dependent hydrolase (beta-lactamase superfamily II)
MVKRWDIITVGNLSRNRYWGEGDQEALRPAVCTTSLVIGERFAVLVDPALDDSARMAAELDRRTGSQPSDIGVVFLTHQHGDHHAGLDHFSDARWLAAPAAAAAINASGDHSREVEAAEGTLFDGIEIVHTPGHTPSHHSLRFQCDGLRVVIAGDAVMTRDFWMHRQGYFNSADFDMAARTIEALRDAADIVVPGHDNYFLTSTAPFVD